MDKKLILIFASLIFFTIVNADSKKNEPENTIITVNSDKKENAESTPTNIQVDKNINKENTPIPVEDTITPTDSNNKAPDNEKPVAKTAEEGSQEAAKALGGDGHNINSDDKVYGNKDAPVVLIEYSSPTCRHCAYYHKEIFPTIKKKYLDTNKIAYVVRPFVMNKLDLDAAVIPYCAGDTSKFFTILETILSSQDKWLTNGDYLSPLTTISELVGVKKEQYQTCLKDDKITQILIQNNRAALNDEGFKLTPGTPAFFINGVKLKEAYNVENLSKLLDAALKETSKKS